MREKWLYGWHRYQSSPTILLGGSVHCCCCGRFQGVTCFVASDDFPATLPDWPFEEADCPLCAIHQRPNIAFPDLPKRVVDAYRLGFNKGVEFQRKGDNG